MASFQRHSLKYDWNTYAYNLGSCRFGLLILTGWFEFGFKIFSESICLCGYMLNWFELKLYYMGIIVVDLGEGLYSYNLYRDSAVESYR